MGKCLKCFGKGYIIPTQVGPFRDCRRCGGSGFLSAFVTNFPDTVRRFGYTRPCPDCHGSGYASATECPQCHGTGWDPLARDQRVPHTTFPSYLSTSRAAHSTGGATVSVIWAIAWLLLIGPLGVDVLSNGAPLMESSALGRVILDVVYLTFWFGGVAFFLYRAIQKRASKKS